MIPFKRLTAAFLCVGLGGCLSIGQDRHTHYQPKKYHALGGYSDYKDGVYTTKAAKKAARIDLAGRHACSSDFKDGFEAAYVNLAQGGSGEIPPIPPEKYWATAYRTESGHAKAQEWFEGFSAGVNSAYSQGLFRQREVAPSAGASVYEDPNDNLAVTRGGFGFPASGAMQQPMPTLVHPQPMIGQPYAPMPQPMYPPAGPSVPVPRIEQPTIPAPFEMPTQPGIVTPDFPTQPSMPGILPQLPTDSVTPNLEPPGMRAPDSMPAPIRQSPSDSEPAPSTVPSLDAMPNTEAPSTPPALMPEAKLPPSEPPAVKQTKGSASSSNEQSDVWPPTNSQVGRPWQ